MTWGFAGEWQDPTSGLQYLRARWYQPQTGRFTQVDPFPGVLSLPGTLHPYVYGLNSPAMYTDPSGESVLGAILLGAFTGSVFGGFAEGLSQMVQYGRHGLTVEQALGCLDWSRIAVAAVAGGISGALSFWFGSYGVSAILQALQPTSSFWTAIGYIALSGWGGGLSNVIGTLSGHLLESLVGRQTSYNNRDLVIELLGSFLWGVGLSSSMAMVETFALKPIYQFIYNAYQMRYASLYKDKLWHQWWDYLNGGGSYRDWEAVRIMIFYDSAVYSWSVQAAAQRAAASAKSLLDNLGLSLDVLANDNLIPVMLDMFHNQRAISR